MKIIHYFFVQLQPSWPKPVQSQKNNVRTTFSECCSNIIFADFEQVLAGWECSNFMKEVFVFISKTELKLIYSVIESVKSALGFSIFSQIQKSCKLFVESTN